jgi:hypothetical protein
LNNLPTSEELLPTAYPPIDDHPLEPFDLVSPDSDNHSTNSHESIDSNFFQPHEFGIHAINFNTIPLIAPHHDVLIDDSSPDSPLDIDNSCLLDHHNIDLQPNDTFDLDIQSIHTHDFDGGRAHLDDGSQVTTTHCAGHLHNYRLFSTENPSRTRLKDAGGTRHQPIGYGFMHIPAPNATGYIPLLSFHTPGIPAIIVSSLSLEKLHQ